MGSPLLHGSQGIRHRKANIVVGVNAHLTGKLLSCRRGNLGHLTGQSAAVGVTQHHEIRAGLLSCLPRGHGVFGVVLKTIERMLGIIDNLALVLFEERDGVGDHRDVFLWRRAQYFLHVQKPRLAKDRYHRSFSIQQ